MADYMFTSLTMCTETGGLFRLITRLTVQKVPQKKKISSLDALVSYLGKYFQIRDDYMNLTPEVLHPLLPHQRQPRSNI